MPGKMQLQLSLPTCMYHQHISLCFWNQRCSGCKHYHLPWIFYTCSIPMVWWKLWGACLLRRLVLNGTCSMHLLLSSLYAVGPCQLSEMGLEHDVSGEQNVYFEVASQLFSFGCHQPCRWPPSWSTMMWGCLDPHAQGHQYGCFSQDFHIFCFASELAQVLVCEHL